MNDETRRSQTARLRLGEPLPSSSSLPTHGELGELLQSVSAENVKTAAVDEAAPMSTGAATAEDETAPDPADSSADDPGVFRFSPVPEGYRLPTLTGDAGSGRSSAVDAENVKTADRVTENEPSRSVTLPASSPPPGDDEWIDVAPVSPEPDPNSMTLWDLP